MISRVSERHHINTKLQILTQSVYIKPYNMYDMFPRGHAGFLMIIYAVSMRVLSPTNTFLIGIGLPVAVMMSISPDIDISDRSILSNLNHRGITHTIWFSTLVSLIFYSFLILSTYITSVHKESIIFLTFIVFMGYTSHIILDMVNEGGVRPIYTKGYLPTNIRLGVSLIESDSVKGNNSLFILGTLAYLGFIIL